MKFIIVIATIALTILCWGIYGPVLHEGQHYMGGSKLLPFLFVGVAYFVIAVAVPVTMLRTYGEKGHWTASGTIWSLLAGAAGAVGALGIIFAFANTGRPVYVMPLVFGGAPIVNSFVTIFLGRAMKNIGPLFLAGLIMVLMGSVTVLIFKPSAPQGTQLEPTSFTQWIWIIGSVTTTILCWGVYGPVLHKGQMNMAGSRLRPLICVGLAYFAIAVAVPAVLLTASSEWDAFSWRGSFWSFAAGAAGALGALGIIMAFNFGGKPVYVMPLVFGGAPVVNTFTSIVRKSQFPQVGPLFYAGLILVAAGAAIVLIFAPRGTAHAPAASKPVSKESDAAASPAEASGAEASAAEASGAEA